MYNSVTEKETGNGYTNYTFSVPVLEVPPSGETFHMVATGVVFPNGTVGAAHVNLFSTLPFPGYGFAWNTAPPVSKDWLYGNLLTKSTYSETGSPLLSEAWGYNWSHSVTANVDTLYNLNMNILEYGIVSAGNGASGTGGTLNADGSVSTEGTGFGITVGQGGSGAYMVGAHYYRYPTYMGTSLINQQTQSLSTPGGNNVSTVENTTYNNKLFPYIVSTLNSDGSYTLKKYIYPFDYNLSCSASMTPEVAAIQALVAKNMVSTPVEEQTMIVRNGVRQLTGAKYTKYTIVGNNVYPQAVYAVETKSPLIDTTVSSVSCVNGVATLSKNAAYQLELNYQSYDNSGNINQYARQSGVVSCVIWSATSTSPVAQVTNAKVNDIFYDSFEEGDGNSTTGDAKTGHYSYISGTNPYSKTLNNLDPGAYTLSYWSKAGNGTWSFISQSVTAGSSYTFSIPGQIDDVRFYPSAAQMTTYTYDTLTGMTSITDPKGEITFYEYDSFQRLMNIKDKDGNIIKYTDYHYQGQ